MCALVDRLVGIYKTHNCTESVTINPHTAASINAATGEEMESTAMKKPDGDGAESHDAPHDAPMES